MYNVLERLRSIESPNEDTIRAITSAEQMEGIKNMQHKVGGAVEDGIGDSTSEGTILDETSRKHFQDAADELLRIPDMKLRQSHAELLAKLFSKQNTRFDSQRFFQAAGLAESSDPDMQLSISADLVYGRVADELLRIPDMQLRQSHDELFAKLFSKQNTKFDSQRFFQAAGLAESSDPDENAAERRKRLQAIKDKNEDDAISSSSDWWGEKDKHPDMVQLVKGTRYGGSNQKYNDNDLEENVFEDQFNKLTEGWVLIKTPDSTDTVADSAMATDTDNDPECQSPLDHLLRLSGLRSSGYEELTPEDLNNEEAMDEGEDDNVKTWATSPDPKYADANTQLVSMSGGINRPKRQINPDNYLGDNPLAMKKLGRTGYGLNLEENLWALYKEHDFNKGNT